MKSELAALPIAELRKRAQGSAPEAGRDPLIGHTVRFFSIYFTKACLYIGMPPIWVTIWSVVLFLVGMGMFFFNDMTLSFVGIGIVYISILLDGTNGEVARLHKYRPEIGSYWVEPISHDIQYALMFLPLMVNAYMNTGSLLVIYAGFFATIGKLVNRFLIARYDTLRAGERKGADTEGEATIPFNPNVSLPHKIYRFLNRNFFSSVGFIIPLGICTAFNRVDIFLYIFAATYSAFAAAHFLKQIVYVIRVDKPAT